MRKVQQRRVRGLVVGASVFRDPGLAKLGLTDRDTRRLANALRAHAPSTRKKPAITILTESMPDRKLKPTQSNILLQVDALTKRAEPDEVVIFGAFSHGFEIDGESFIFPSDGLLDHAPKTALPTTLLLEALQKCQARTKVLIFDVCREPYPPAFRRGLSPNGPPGTPPALLRDVTIGVGWVVLYACSQGERSHEDLDLEHGVYLYHLVAGLEGQAQSLRSDWVSLIQAHLYACDQTSLWAQDRGVDQNPEINCRLVGDILLASKGGPPPHSSRPPIAEAFHA